MPNIFGANGGGSSNIFSSAGGSILSLLSSARAHYKGIGLSQSSRAISDNYLNQSVSGLNSILSQSVQASSSVAGAQIAINALRSKTPLSHLSQDLQDQAAKEAAEANADNGAAAASTTTGTNVNTKV